MEHKRFSDKVVLITGASKGIGRKTAFKMANLGAKVVLTGRDKAALHRVYEKIGEMGGNSAYIQGDICDQDCCKEMVRFTLDRYGKLDILINNAGVSMRGNFSELEFEVIDRVYRTNLIGATFISAVSLPYIRRSNGSIVFVSSIAGIRGLPFNSVYCASKMALRAIAESIRIEEFKNNIHVGLVYAGITQIDPGKQTIGSGGDMITLNDRSKRKIMTQEEVALAILGNIEDRKFISVLSPLGKLNSVVQRISPKLSEFILCRSIDKIVQDGK